jgi:hypothetical protein
VIYELRNTLRDQSQPAVLHLNGNSNAVIALSQELCSFNQHLPRDRLYFPQNTLCSRPHGSERLQTANAQPNLIPRHSRARGRQVILASCDQRDDSIHKHTRNERSVRVGCDRLSEHADLRGRRSDAPHSVQGPWGGRSVEAVGVGGCGTAGEGLGWVEKKAGEPSVDGDCTSVEDVLVRCALHMLSSDTGHAKRTHAKTLICA